MNRDPDKQDLQAKYYNFPEVSLTQRVVNQKKLPEVSQREISESKLALPRNPRVQSPMTVFSRIQSKGGSVRTKLNSNIFTLTYQTLHMFLGYLDALDQQYNL